MKALTSFDNSDKGKLLHELFPDEIPCLLDHIAGVCEDLQTHQEDYRNNWNFGLMSFDMWLQLADQTAALIKRYRSGMIRSSKVFSEQLFFSYTTLFVNDRIIKYADKVVQNAKFKLAVELLYHP